MGHKMAGFARSLFAQPKIHDKHTIGAMGAKNSTIEGVDEVKQLTNRKIVSFAAVSLQPLIIYVFLIQSPTKKFALFTSNSCASTRTAR